MGINILHVDAADKHLAGRGQRARRVHRVVTGLERVEQLQHLALGGDRRRSENDGRALADDNAERRTLRRVLHQRARLLDRTVEGGAPGRVAKLHRGRGVDHQDDVLVHPGAAEEVQLGEERTRERDCRKDED